MATVIYLSGSWTSSGPANDFLPGQVHGPWMASGLKYGEAVHVSAHPVAGPNRSLAIESVRIEGDASGRRMLFNVRNVGSNAIPGYAVGLSRIGP